MGECFVSVCECTLFVFVSSNWIWWQSINGSRVCVYQKRVYNVRIDNISANRPCAMIWHNKLNIYIMLYAHDLRSWKFAHTTSKVWHKKPMNTIFRQYAACITIARYSVSVFCCCCWEAQFIQEHFLYGFLIWFMLCPCMMHVCGFCEDIWAQSFTLDLIRLLGSHSGLRCGNLRFLAIWLDGIRWQFRHGWVHDRNQARHLPTNCKSV